MESRSRGADSSASLVFSDSYGRPSFLLVAEQLRGIDGHGAAGRDPGGDKSDQVMAARPRQYQRVRGVAS